VDCFYEGENMLVINPDECIDCGVCEPECPIEAIKPESEDLIEMMEMNREYSAKWPNINTKKEPLPEADEFKDVENKYTKYFSPLPGGEDN
jgi:ferredoxin